MIYAQTTDITQECLDSIQKTYSYDRVNRFWNINGLISVEKDNKSGVVNKQGNIVIPIEYDHIGATERPIFSVRKEDKWGFIDSVGSVIVPIVYENVGIFGNSNVVGAKLNGKWGLINENDDVILNFNYDKVNQYSDLENLIFMQKDSKWELFNDKGIQVLPNKFDEITISFFASGRFVKENGKWGKINEFGEIIMPIKYDFIREVLVDRTTQAKRDGKFFLLDVKNGNEIEEITAVMMDMTIKNF